MWNKHVRLEIAFVIYITISSHLNENLKWNIPYWTTTVITHYWNVKLFLILFSDIKNLHYSIKLKHSCYLDFDRFSFGSYILLKISLKSNYSSFLIYLLKYFIIWWKEKKNTNTQKYMSSVWIWKFVLSNHHITID